MHLKPGMTITNVHSGSVSDHQVHYYCEAITVYSLTLRLLVEYKLELHNKN
jgi:hypothetical protein